jgi:hypothetical protein
VVEEAVSVAPAGSFDATSELGSTSTATSA